MKIFYICDGQACGEPSGACGNDCFHTSDINHAKNFTKFDDAPDKICFFENKKTIKGVITTDNKGNYNITPLDPDERPQGDLISREALKKDIDKFIGYLDEDMICRIKVVIDNTPTVKEKSYAMGFQDGAEDGLQGIRPHGKWIPETEDNGYFRCSICKDIETLKYPFCPNCGARMQEKEGKTCEKN